MELLINTVGLIALVPSPQGAMLAVLERDGRALGIYTSTGRFQFALPLPSVSFDVFTGLIWSPDGRYVAAGTRQCQVFVWEVGTRSLIAAYTRHYGPIRDLAWSPTESALASIAADWSLHLWNPLTGAQIMPPRFCKRRCYALAWSPDGASLAVSVGRTVQLFSKERATCLYTYRGHEQEVISLTWSPDGTSLVSVSRDHRAHLWRVPLDRARWRILFGSWGVRRLTYVDPAESAMLVARFSPDGRAVAMQTESGIRIWSSTSTVLLASLPDYAIRAFAWSYDSTNILVVSGSTCLCWRWKEDRSSLFMNNKEALP